MYSPGSLSRPWAPSHIWLRSLLPRARVPWGPRRRPRDSQTPGPLRCCFPTRAAAALGMSGKGDGTSPKAPLSAAAARRHPAPCPSSPCGAAARGALGKAVSAPPGSPGRGCLLGRIRTTLPRVPRAGRRHGRRAPVPPLSRCLPGNRVFRGPLLRGRPGARLQFPSSPSRPAPRALRAPFCFALQPKMAAGRRD